MSLRRNLPTEIQSLVNTLRHARDGGPAARRATAALIAAAPRHHIELEFWPDRFAVPRIMRIWRRQQRLRIQRIVRRGASTRTFKGWSDKMGEMIETTYFYEFDCYRWLEVDWIAAAYWEQPHVLWFWHRGKVHTYTPDFEIERADDEGLAIWEIKPDNWKENEPEDVPRYGSIEAAYAELGLGFVPRTASEIWMQPRFTNVVALFEQAHVAVPPATPHILARRYAAAEELPLAELLTGRYALSREVVMRLVALGELRVNLDHPLDSQTIVRRAPQH